MNFLFSVHVRVGSVRLTADPWSPVSRIVPKNEKGGPLRVFELPFFCKTENRKKLKGGPFGDIKKIAKKVSQSRNKLQKNFGQGRDSNPRPSVWQTSKKPN